MNPSDTKQFFHSVSCADRQKPVVLSDKYEASANEMADVYCNPVVSTTTTYPPTAVAFVLTGAFLLLGGMHMAMTKLRW